MITETIKTEADYRAIVMDSSSSLKDFSLDRKKYYRKYILSESVEDKDTQAAVMGRVVETLLLEPELFDNRFYMSACASSPTGLMLEFVEALYRATRDATDEYGNVMKSFEEMSKEAYVESGFKIKYEAVISKFIGSDAEIFYNELRQVRANNLTVVTVQDVTNAERIVEDLKVNSVTKDVVNLTNSSRWEIKNQFQIEGYIVDDHLFKSMMDKVVIDHVEKTIQVYDLKCVWAVEGFYEEYYLYRRAYIQAFLYYRAANDMAKEGDTFGYFVYPPKFIVCDSTGYFNPLVYTLDMSDLVEAYEGFEHKGRQYPGVKTLISDLDWALETNTWNISRKNYMSNGLVKLKG